jgi:hypothetical protein
LDAIAVAIWARPVNRITPERRGDLRRVISAA